jgi:hypothetical protein
MNRFGTDTDDERTSYGCMLPDDISDDRVRKVEEGDITAATRASGDMEARGNYREGILEVVVAHRTNLYRR